VKAYVSLWSADLLGVRADVDRIDGVADGLHVDVFDGHEVPELVFGPDFVAALRAHTAALLDVHLAVEAPDAWAPRFAEAGADLVTVQPRHCADPHATFAAIAGAGARPAASLEVEEAVGDAVALLEHVDRVLVMGTALGVKGVGLDPATPDRVAALVQARDRSARRPEVVVDGGIRRHTVPELARAGADGVVPGSLVFGDPDPRAAIGWIHGLGA
jgi:ribulose-phosphate 3-epimerase